MRGVNVVSYFQVCAGLTSHARSIGALLETVCPVWYTNTRHTFAREADTPPSSADGPGDLTIWVVNASELPREFDPGLGRRHVGVFMWEVEGAPPPGIDRAAPLVDEVWAFSRFVERIFSSCGRPVHFVPSFVPSMPARRRSSGDVFRILTVCDTTSNVDRKNPVGALEAFKLAFDPKDPVELVVKTRRTSYARNFWAAFAEAAKGWPVRIFDANLETDEHRQLIADADVFLSLHRSEGQGLPIAEALRAGVPTVATGFGGNVDWQTRENSIVVPYRLQTLTQPSAPYPVGARWAAPDLNRAAAALRRLYGDPALRARLGEEARRSSDQTLDGRATLQAMKTRIDQLTGGT